MEMEGGIKSQMSAQGLRIKTQMAKQGQKFKSQMKEQGNKIKTKVERIWPSFFMIVFSISGGLIATILYAVQYFELDVPVPVLISIVCTVLVVSIVVVVCWFKKAIFHRRTWGNHWIKTSDAEELVGVTEFGTFDTVGVLPNEKHLLAIEKVEEFWEKGTTGEQTTQIPPSHFIFAASKFVDSFTPQSFEALYKEIDWVHLLQGEILFKQGDSSEDGMYILVNGKVGVLKQRAGQSKPTLISQFHAGDSFGELSLFQPEPRSVTCMASAECDLIKITRQCFNLYAKKHPDAFISFVKTTLGRQWRIANYVLFDFFGVNLSSDTLNIADLEQKSDTLNIADLEQKSDTLNIADLEQKSDKTSENLSSPVDAESITDTLHLHTESISCADSPHMSPFIGTPIKSSATLSSSSSSSSAAADIHSLDSGARRRTCDCSEFFQTTDSRFKSLFDSEDRILEMNAGQVLIHEGSQSKRKVFILLEGKLCSYTHDQTVISTLYPGCLIGAIVYFSGVPYMNTIRCLTRSRVYWLGRKQFEENPSALAVQIALALAHSMKPCILKFFDGGLQLVWCRASHTLFRSGEPVQGLYIVISGRLRIIQDKHEGVCDVSPGEIVGEMSLLAGASKHLNTVICVRDSELVQISTEAFDLLQHDYPQVLRKCSRILAQRLGGHMTENHRQIRSRFTGIKTITIFPSSNDVDMKDFCRRFISVMSEHGKTLLCEASDVDEKLGAETVRKLDNYLYRTQFVQWLNYQNEKYSFIVLIANHETLSWTKLCVNQADLVLIVADSSASPSVSTLEDHMIWGSSPGSRRPLCRKALVLVHSDDVKLPSKTNLWLECRPLDPFCHFHVKKSRMADYFRLARYLTDRTVGLVLSGGGARGLAHLGVIKAMEQHGITADYIAGTSQGAFMAALYAMHLCSEAMAPDTRLIASKLGNTYELMMDATLPVMAYFSGYRFNLNIKELFKDYDIEDLWIPFFCITTNISQADISVHRTDTLWKAVRGSMTILDYLPPMRTSDGDLLIDGGYTNNMPVDIMRELCQPRLLIGADIEAKDGDIFKNIEDFGEYCSGWYLMARRTWNMINPFSRRFRVPRYGDIISSLNYINHNKNIRELVENKRMDIYINPDLGDAKLLDYHKLDQIVKIGYHSAYKTITQHFLQTSHRDLIGAFVIKDRANSVDNLVNKTATSTCDVSLTRRKRRKNLGVYTRDDLAQDFSFENSTEMRRIRRNSE